MKRTIFHSTSIALLLLLISSFSSFASHIVGGSLRYILVSDSTYKIALELFADCGSDTGLLNLLQVGSPRVKATRDTVNREILLTLDTPVSGVVMAQPCAFTIPDQCTSLTSVIPGIKKFTYSTNFVLPSAAGVWHLVFGGSISVSSGLPWSAGRSSSGTNLLFGTTLELEAMIDARFPSSAPVIANTIPTWFCMNQPSSYTPGITDPDGDSIAILLVPPVDGNTGIAAPFISPYTATNPLAVVPGSFIFSPAIGNMSFLPNQFQKSVMVYKIEKRRGGILIGSSQYEMTVVVKGCSDPCTLGIVETPKDEQVVIYPDPAKDLLNISIGTFEYNSVTISNALGQTVLKQKLVNKETVLNTANLSPGIYYLLLEGSNIRKMQKISISR